MAESRIPVYLRSPIYGGLLSFYGGKPDDFVGKYEDYESVQAFFTRPTKPRKIEGNSTSSLVSPADSRVLSVAEVKEDSVFLVKGKTYSFTELLFGKKQNVSPTELLNKMKKNPENKIYSAIFYLCPGDYHRYHSPADFIVKRRIHIAGYLYPVAIKYVENVDNVYTDNERVVLFGKWHHGIMNVVFVGATNVGSMTLDIDPELATNENFIHKKINSKKMDNVKINRGDQLGMFKFGSTVVMLFEAPPNYELKDLRQGQQVDYGELIGQDAA